MEIQVNNLTSKLITDNPKILEALHKKYSFKVPGYQYTPQYKRKVWDGTKSYFKKNGEFRTGLLHRIEEDLKLIGVPEKDLYLSGDPVTVDPMFWGNPESILPVDKYEYKDFQRDAIYFALDRKRCIVESPTSSGKSVMMAGLIKNLQEIQVKKIVVLFREKGILKQTYEFFKSCGIENLGINFGEGFIYGDVMLSTVQSIHKILDTHLYDAGALIIDEAHQFCKGETTIAAIEAFPNAYFRVAFTATAPTEKSEDIHGRMTLEGAFGEVYVTRTVTDLIEDGSIARPIIQVVEFSPEITESDKDLDYLSIYEKFVTTNTERNNLITKIVSSIKSSGKPTKTLILCKDLQHLEILKSSLNAYSVEGKDSIEDRYSVIKDFLKDPNNPVLIGTNVLQTGISIHEITHMIDARGLEGRVPTLQGLGRGMRKSDGKHEFYFFDFYDKVPYMEDHSKKRIKHYKKLELEINYVKL